MDCELLGPLSFASLLFVKEQSSAEDDLVSTLSRSVLCYSLRDAADLLLILEIQKQREREKS